jgi:hypothetical protein
MGKNRPRKSIYLVTNSGAQGSIYLGEPIFLEDLCINCQGTPNKKCAICNGRGHTINENGTNLLEFLKTYFRGQ